MDADQVMLLTEGSVEIIGRVLDSSNATFALEVTLGERYAWAIYKPRAGERPLHDFDPGLHRRERAAYLLSDWLGWGIVPTTVIRGDLPLGEGSLQWFVEFEPADHYFTLYSEAPETHDALRRLALFDCVANNTDRKGGHVLRDRDGRIWGIDHGLCFAEDFKLRTVIWDFGGEPIPPELLADIAPLADEVPPAIAELLEAREVVALRHRVRRLLDRAVLPIDRSGRRYPWPLV